jgi:hypothetical protein
MLLVLALLASACGQTPAGPRESRVVLETLGDSVVFVPAALRTSEQLSVVARHSESGGVLVNVEVSWQLVEGAAALSPQSATSVFGVASTSVMPTQPGTHRVRATTPRMVGDGAIFELRVVAVPAITALQPATVAAGGEVVITGTDFSAVAAHNDVYFSGVRGVVLSATATEIRALVPPCLPSRAVTVTVGLGNVLSAGRPLMTTGGALTAVELQPGQLHTIMDAGSFACVRLPETPASALYLITAHNVAAAVAPPLSFELRALLPGGAAAAPPRYEPAAAVPYAESWEAALRARERSLPSAGEHGPATLRTGPLLQVAPSVGEEREFNVLNSLQTTERVRAVVRRVSQRAVIWVDVEAADAFTVDDISFFATLFDSTIYPTAVSVFGEPSDIDGNQRIFVLFTPRVNMLTPRGESSVITGYFHGCDLLAARRCTGSNEAEIFYSLVPDPQGRWSSARTHTMVRTAVPPILAHEFQHMIHFARRGLSTDVLWLSEALAHTAEELVGDALLPHNPALAATFATPNLTRAQRYLQAPRVAGVLADGGNGSVEMRGAAWLFLKYLRTHHGGNDLLRRLTLATTSGVTSVTQQTGRPWAGLMTDFGIALWAHGAPELLQPLPASYGFGGYDLRGAFAPIQGGWALRPTAVQWGDFVVTGSIAPATQDYVLLSAPANSVGAPLSFVFSGARGAPLPPGSAARLSILRVR